MIDAKGEARMKLKKMKEGRRSMTEYCNEFRLTAREAELDNSTAGEWLLSGRNTELQDSWGAVSNEYKGMAKLVQWAIRKETKLVTGRHIQRDRSNKGTTTPLNNNRPQKPKRDILNSKQQ